MPNPEVLGPANSTTLSSVSVSDTTTAIVGGNGGRSGLIIFNEGSATAYIAYASTASLTAYTVQLVSGAYWEMPQPIYNGPVSGITVSSTAELRITELS